MKAAEAGGRLAEMVAAAGFDRGDVAVQRVLDLFAEFASLPVDDVNVEEDGDRLLFETATAPTGEFEVSLGRQLFLEEGGENQGMVDVSVVARLPGADELADSDGDQVWGCGGPPWPDGYGAAEEFIAEVGRAPAFGAVADRTATRVFVDGG